MGLIDRYVAAAALKATAVVLLILLAIIGFISLTTQLEDVGKGAFGVGDALLVVLMQFPRNIFDVFPIAALLGGMMGLGTLAKNSELVAARAAGVSPRRLAVAAGMAGLVLAGIAAGVGQYVMPPAERFSEEYADELKRERSGLSGLSGSWLRDGARIFNILQVETLTSLGGIYLYRFDEAGQLESVAFARRAEILPDDHWRLNDVNITRFGPRFTTEAYATLDVESEIDTSVMEVAVIDTHSMNFESLREYTAYLEENQLDAGRYEMAFWQRIANIAAVPVMLLLAVPFVFGPLRSGGNSARFVVGFLIGVIYLLGKGALADGAQVYGIPAWITAWIPVALILLAAGVGLARVR
ncbi:MAG: LPS export ABC transporter permease LptG [Gammaproteobacteria bacterium]